MTCPTSPAASTRARVAPVPPHTSARAWLGARLALLALTLAACGRDGPSVDVREPLGARNPAAGGPARAVLAAHAGRQAVVPPTASLPPATYTAEQAARGAQVYQATCARCHPPGAFDGGAFAVGWNEARV